jgi:Skp family chaperone for outer membrane proteins
MKKGHSIFTALLAFTVCLQMQAASIVTVDMTELYNGYYKTLEANEKIKGSVKKAEDQTKTLLGEGKALVDEYNEILEMVENPALTDEAKAKAEQDAKAKITEIEAKKAEVSQFQTNMQRSLQQRQRTYRDLFMDEIRGVVLEVSKERNGDLVLDSSGLTATGVPAVVYSDPSWDITDIVLERVNADAPDDDE